MRIKELYVSPGSKCEVTLPGPIASIEEMPGDSDWGLLAQSGAKVTFTAGTRIGAHTRFYCHCDNGSYAIDVFIAEAGNGPGRLTLEAY